MQKIKDFVVLLALATSITTTLYGINRYVSERAIFKHDATKVISKVETLEKEKNAMSERLARIEAKIDMIIKGMNK